MQFLRSFWVMFLSLSSFRVLLVLSFFSGGCYCFLLLFWSVVSLHFFEGCAGVNGSEVNESSAVFLSGGVVFPLLPFLVVVLFSVVFPSCVVLFSHLLPLSLVGGCVVCPSSFWVWCFLRLLAAVLPFSSKIELNTVNKLKQSQTGRSERDFSNNCLIFDFVFKCLFSFFSIFFVAGSLASGKVLRRN